MQQGHNAGRGVGPCVREGGSIPIRSPQSASRHQTPLLLTGSSRGKQRHAWPFAVSVVGALLVCVFKGDSVEKEPRKKVNSFLFAMDLCCSSMLIFLPAPSLCFVSQSLFLCPGMQSSPGSLQLPSSSIPQATSPSSQPFIGMQLLWASTLTTAPTSCLLSWWAPTPLPPISSLQVNHFLPGLLSLSRHSSLLCLVWRPAG